MAKKQLTAEQQEIYDMLMTDIIFDNNTLPMYEKCMSILNEPDKPKIFLNLHDGKLLSDIMCVCNQFCKWANDVKKIGVEALDTSKYLLFKKYYSLIGDMLKMINSIAFNCDELERTTIPMLNVHEYNSLYLNALNSSQENNAPKDFCGVYDSVVQLQNDRVTVDINVLKVIRQTVNHTYKLLSDTIYLYSSAYETKLIEDGAREFFLNNYEEEYDKLKKQTRKLFDQHCPVLNAEHWYKMKITEERAMSLASDNKLYNAKDECLNGYSTSDRRSMDENNPMILLLTERFPDDKLFDYKLLPAGFPSLLFEINHDNLSLFYRLVLRGNIIRCKLYPELKPQFDAWMKGETVDEAKDKEEKANETECELSETDRNTMNEILSILAKGSWKQPANKERISEWVEVLYGAKPEKLDKEDVDASEKFRQFFRTGKGGKSFSRLQVSTANVIGYLMKWGCLDSSPQQLSKVFFDNESNKVNINHGKNNDSSASFRNLIPFMDKYRQRIIEKHD